MKRLSLPRHILAAFVILAAAAVAHAAEPAKTHILTRAEFDDLLANHEQGGKLAKIAPPARSSPAQSSARTATH